MSDKREMLIQRIIRLYGLEHPITIQFCQLAERWADNTWNNKCLQLMVEAHEADPQF